MDLGVREVGQAADVVQVEVRDDDVADVVTPEAELLDLVGGGFLWLRIGLSKWRVAPIRPTGFAQSCEPKPVSTSTRPLSVSTSSTWQTTEALAGGFMVPQLRW